MSSIRTAIGLMSGTSMDGIDVALLRTDGKTLIERLASGFFPYAAEFRDRLEQGLEEAKTLADRSERPGDLAELETRLTLLHADAVKTFLADHRMAADTIDLIGFHGQTILHRPEKGMTVQLGDGQLLAGKTGIATLSDMRANDMAHGGQGAPLIPVYHQALAASLDNPGKAERAEKPVCFVNIGGISNITYVGGELIALDAGPGNALIDQWVQRHVGISHDQGGMIAAEGEIDTALVDDYLAHPFFEQDLPKSLDRGDFTLPEAIGPGVETVARSLAAVTARSIFAAAEHLPVPPAIWVIAGGGRHNPHIMADLRQLAEAQKSTVFSAEQVGLDGDAMEAEGWAYLAVRAFDGQPITFPKTTGCQRPVTGGVLNRP